MDVKLIRVALPLVVVMGVVATGASAFPAHAAVRYTTHVYHHDMDGDGQPDLVTVRTVKAGNSFSNPATATVRVKSSETSEVARLSIKPVQVGGDGLTGPLSPYDFEAVDGNRGDELVLIGLRGVGTTFHVVIAMSHGRLRLLREPGGEQPAHGSNIWLSSSSNYSFDVYARRVVKGTPIVTHFGAFANGPGWTDWAMQVREFEWKSGSWALRSDRTFTFSTWQDVFANFDFGAYGMFLGYPGVLCAPQRYPTLPSYCPSPPHPEPSF